MGFFSSLLGKDSEKAVDGYFKLISGYTPVFTSFEGSIYEMEMTRAAIHAFATHASKLKPVITGSGNEQLERRLQYRPNPYMDTTKFLYRLATIFSVNNSAFITPVYSSGGEVIEGYYPLYVSTAVVVDTRQGKFLRFSLEDGTRGALPVDQIGILTQYQYRSEFFGEDNRALYPTMQLLKTQAQGIVEGVKNSANVRFLAKLTQPLKDKTINEERERFIKDNLSAGNNSGVLMFDSKYSEVKAIESKPLMVNKAQVDLINDNVYSYFGTNKAILQNTYDENTWNAYYEGKIEPWAIQLSLVMTNMTFTERELAFGNNILWTANRLQYASNQTKLQIVSTLFDRGQLTRNEGREIFNMPQVDDEDGDAFFMRLDNGAVSGMDTQGEEDPDALQAKRAGIQGYARFSPGAKQADRK